MSGGSFDFVYSKALNFADELEDRLNADLQFPVDDAVRQRLRRLVTEARNVGRVMREAEWLYSGDHGEATFMTLAARIDAETAP